MLIREIEERLANARLREEKAIAALKPKWKGGEQEEYRAASQTVLDLERKLAQAKGLEHALTLDFPWKWDIGCPYPHLFKNDHKAFLLFLLREDHPGWDGSTVEVIHGSGAKIRPMALVEFAGCVSAKLGAPNDEVLDGHSLAGHGLEPCSAQLVVHSRWLAEIEAINKVHSCYDPGYWKELKHYVFWFHDSTFECIAKSFQVDIFRESIPVMLGKICPRLVE